MFDSDLMPSDFIKLFGSDDGGLSRGCLDLIEKYDFRYRVITGAARDQVLLDILERIESGQLTQAGPSGKERWEKGWSENKMSFLNSNNDLSKLVPKYLRSAEPVRIYQNYAETSDPDFELHWYEVFRHWIFETYMSDAKIVYEFGCGSAHNLASLATLYPDKKYYGLDWASSSIEIVNRLGDKFDWDMTGRQFDFFQPDTTFEIEDDSVLFTIGALEQTGTNYEGLLNYWLTFSPKMYIHCEPIVEWYDSDNLIDYLAIKFHENRNYWVGFHGRLLELEEEGRVEILKSKRSFFGSAYIEGYSQLIWRPIH